MKCAVWILLLGAGCSITSGCSKGETLAGDEQEAEESAPMPSDGTVGSSGPEQPPSWPTGDEVLPLTPPSIELLLAGKPPLRELRTQYEKGSKQTLRISTKVATEGLLKILKFQNTLPEVIYEIELETLEIDPDGKALVAFEVAGAIVENRPGVNPETLEHHREAAAWIKGFKGTYAVDPRGISQADGLVAPPNTPRLGHQVMEQIRRALSQTSLPLPDEPVGKGGKWKVRQVVEQGGIRIEQTATFELTRANGSRMSIKTLVEQTAPKQLYFPPGGSPGKGFELILLESQAIGKGKWDRTLLGPVAAQDRTVTNQQWVGPKPELVVVSTSTEAVFTLKSK